MWLAIIFAIQFFTISKEMVGIFLNHKNAVMQNLKLT